MSLITKMPSLFRKLRRDTAGLAAIEFALILPVMLISIMGAVEVSNGMLADRKVTMMASTLADLVSQDTSITNAEMALTLAASKGVLAPVQSATVRLRVSSIVADANGKTTVAWSDAQGFGPRSKGSVVVVPADIVSPNNSVILSEVEVRYDSSFAEFFSSIESLFGQPIDASMKSGWTLSDRFYLRPRRSVTITRVP